MIGVQEVRGGLDGLGQTTKGQLGRVEACFLLLATVVESIQ